MTTRRITIAAVQPPYPDDDSLDCHLSTRGRGLALLEETVARNADVVCLPEYFNCAGLQPAAARKQAGKAGEVEETVARVAVKHGAHILLPLLEKRGDRLFNASHLIGPDGQRLFTYDKTHLTIAERTEWGVSPGHRIEVCRTDFGTIGVAVCYDVYFPELFRTFLLNGASLVFFPSLQRSENPEAVLSMLSARAMDCCAFMVRAAYGTPRDQAWRPGKPYGMSCVVHPDGTVLANAGHYEGLAIAVVDCGAEWRKPRCHGCPEQSVRSFLTEDRRPELYRANSELDE